MARAAVRVDVAKCTVGDAFFPASTRAGDRSRSAGGAMSNAALRRRSESNRRWRIDCLRADQSGCENPPAPRWCPGGLFFLLHKCRMANDESRLKSGKKSE